MQAAGVERALGHVEAGAGGDVEVVTSLLAGGRFHQHAAIRCVEGYLFGRGLQAFKVQGDILAGAAAQGHCAVAGEQGIHRLACLFVLLAVAEVAADGTALDVASLDRQLHAAAHLGAGSVLGVAGRLDLQPTAALQLYVASLGLAAANAGAFEQQVAATAQLYLALGVDLRHLGLALCALVLAVVEVAPAIDAGAARAVADLGPGIAVELA
ncbi:hypothetical protein D3C75_788740 [compost metagenome]